MVADALAPCIAMSSTTMLLTTTSDKQVFVFHKEGFQLPLPFQFYKMAENANIFLCLPWKNQGSKGLNNELALMQGKGHVCEIIHNLP